MIRRADNGKWAVPGGYMKAGENFSEACAREVLEETGLHVIVNRLIGVYTSPNLLLEYKDGNKWQLVVLHFEAEAVSGELTTSDESTKFGYFSMNELHDLDMNILDKLRVLDGFLRNQETFVRDDFANAELI